MLLRVIGSILLIVGTSIGAGILALPMVTAAGGFYYACLLLLACWCVMTLGAFFLLEVNYRLPLNSNLITMAKSTLGVPGQLIAWITYLLLLYALISAYLSGGTDVVHSLLGLAHLTVTTCFSSLLFLVILGLVVYLGIRSVDWVNRLLMIAKIALFLLLVAVITPKVNSHLLQLGHPLKLLPAIMVVITSFGFAIIVPSLRVYLKNDLKKMRLALFIGSLVALVAYFLWILIIQGSIDSQQLHHIAGSKHAISSLTNTLIQKLNSPSLASWIHGFTSICMITSFLGVSLSLFDFLADGLQVKKEGKGKLLIALITFLPPLLIVLFMPSIFITALAYAGIFCVILLILLPAIMVWRSRKQSATQQISYQVRGGKWLVLLVLLAAIVLLGIAIVYSG